MSTPSVDRAFILGIDLGVASLGWAIIAPDDATGTSRVIRTGVHLFEAGVEGGKQDPATAMQSGREQSRATPRRQARQQRRQIWRRAYRKRSLLKKLVQHGLLPDADSRLVTPEEIDAYLKSLDASLRAKWESDGHVDHRMRQILPYRLRAEAIHRPLEPYEVGRAIYHLAQRRGFLSNRKTDDDESGDDDKNTGKVKKGIAELAKLMDAAGAKTLGEYFASIDPSNPDHGRIRGRWTDRRWYEDEFECIWGEQAPHHAERMTGDAKREIYRAIFHQRPLKSQRHLIGRCSLLPTKRRAPIADRLFQRFRVLQKVNDLLVIPCRREDVEDTDPKTGELRINKKTGEVKMKKQWVPDSGKRPRPLTEEERAAAIARLSEGDATFTQLRRAGAAPNDSRFNFEREGESKLPGMRTDEKLRAVFGERWDRLSEEERDAVVADCLSFERADAMERRGREHWGLSADNARAFARLKLEEGYVNLSRAAMRRLLPLFERGTPYATARLELFPESFKPVEPVDQLPPVVKAFDDPVSPAVSRALSELRGVVNSIVRRYGKPAHIRIELARDLKKGRKRREAISKQNDVRRKLREAAAYRLLKEFPSRGRKPEDVSGTDVLKVLLADECNWTCPYTGRGFGWHDVFGSQPTIDIEHIWPFRRSLDDSFLNKTLCCVKENREVKRDRLPSEAYSGNRLEEIKQRVARFRGDAARIKLERFGAEAIPPDFTNRHLSESQYVARKAAEYLAMLYGGYSDEEGARRVHVPTGGLTAWLRREWGLNAILSDRDEKDRSDHRHHAIDALIVAFTTPAVIKRLQESAARADEMGSRRRFAGLEPPFVMDDARRAVEAIVVSHRQRRRARGKFHNDTIYSRPILNGEGRPAHRIRKLLDRLSEKEIDAIVDDRIRSVVREAYEERKKEGAKDPKQAFSESKHWPKLPHGVRIRRVRLHSTAKPTRLGGSAGGKKGRGKANERFVDLQSNHHTVIMAKLNAAGEEASWVDEPVSLFDVMQRVREGKPMMSRDVPEGFRFKFTLAANDFVELDDGSRSRAIYRVLNVSKGDMEVVLHHDGRTRDLRIAAKERERVRGSSLFKRNARKVSISYLGEVRHAGG